MPFIAESASTGAPTVRVITIDLDRHLFQVASETYMIWKNFLIYTIKHVK